MSEPTSDPPRLITDGSGAPPELVALVRSLERPPPIPPAIRSDVQGRLSRRARPDAAARRPRRWVGPGVGLAAAVVLGGLVLWRFSAGPRAEAPVAIEAEPRDAQLEPVPLEPTVARAPAELLEPSPSLGQVRPPAPRPVVPREPATTPPQPRSPRSASPPVAASPGEEPTVASRVRAVVDGERASLAACAPPAQRTRRVTLRFRIDADGSVVRVDASGIEPATALRCMEGTAARWQFGPGVGPLTVNAPVVLAASSVRRPTLEEELRDPNTSLRIPEILRPRPAPEAEPPRGVEGGSARAPAPATLPERVSAEDLRRVFAGARTDIQRCVTEGASARRLTVRVAVTDGRGTVLEVAGASPTERRCLGALVGRFRYPRARTRTEVSYPLMVAPRRATSSRSEWWAD